MSKDILIGRPLSSQEEERLKRLKGDYGRRFAEAGFAVFCPDARGFGERDDGRGCVHIGQNAQAIGHALGGLRMWDHLRCMDYLFSRPDIDRQCVGAAGLSMGCEHSMYLGALDERVAFAILSCCIRDLRDEVHDKCHCGCSYIPGLFRFFDWSDIVCLIAPRPVLVQQGLQDYVPMALVESAVAKIGKAYRVADAAGNIDTDFFNGEHEFNFTGALNWLRETLEKTGLLARRSTTTE
jgi:pimeloyl-ACP methyl ester carboxylesterase